MRIDVAAAAATSLATRRGDRRDHQPAGRAGAEPDSCAFGMATTGTSSTSRVGVPAAVRVGDDEADPVADPQQVDDGGVGDPQRHRGGAGVAAQQPAGERAHPGQRLAAASSARPGCDRPRRPGRGRRRRARRPGRTGSRTRSSGAEHGAAGAGRGGGPDGDRLGRRRSGGLQADEHGAPAASAASSRRCSSTRRWSRRTRRSTRPSGPGRCSGFMAPEGRPIRRPCAGNPQAPAGPGQERVRRAGAGSRRRSSRSVERRGGRRRRSRSCRGLARRADLGGRARCSRLLLALVAAPSFCALLAAAVVAVEARALEHHADGVEHLAQPALALGADGERVVGEALHGLEEVAAVGAGVLIGGHWCPPGVTRARDWHSSSSTANATAQCLT